MKFYNSSISSRLSRLKNILIRDENEINPNWLINFSRHVAFLYLKIKYRDISKIGLESLIEIDSSIQNTGLSIYSQLENFSISKFTN